MPKASRNESPSKSLFDWFLGSKTKAKSQKICYFVASVSSMRFERQTLQFLEGPNLKNIGFTWVKRWFSRNRCESVPLDFSLILGPTNAPKSMKSPFKNPTISEDVFRGRFSWFLLQFWGQKISDFSKNGASKAPCKAASFRGDVFDLFRPFLGSKMMSKLHKMCQPCSKTKPYLEHCEGFRDPKAWLHARRRKPCTDD